MTVENACGRHNATDRAPRTGVSPAHGEGGTMKKIGIIICGRYQTCGGGKCFRALRERAGAFAAYPKEEPSRSSDFRPAAAVRAGTSNTSRKR